MQREEKANETKHRPLKKLIRSHEEHNLFKPVHPDNIAPDVTLKNYNNGEDEEEIRPTTGCFSCLGRIFKR